MPASPIGAENRLLQSLPEAVQRRVRPRLEAVTCGLGDVIHEPRGRLDHVWFPTDCVVSLVYTMEDGHTAEVGLVGNEGVVGIALFTGGETTPNQAVVQVAGGAWRLPAAVLQAEFRRGGALQRALLRYTQARITQISQTAVCNRLHSVEQRLCRWLLLTRDRVATDELCMTQDFLGHMLGVRREGVAAAAHHLQDAGLIRYVRGHIRVLDRSGLEAGSCECYRVVRDEFARLLGCDPAREERVSGGRGASVAGEGVGRLSRGRGVTKLSRGRASRSRSGANAARAH